jgi:hypothetical protein
VIQFHTGHQRSISHRTCAGIYLGIFVLAIYSASLSDATRGSAPQGRIRWVILITSVLFIGYKRQYYLKEDADRYFFNIRGTILVFKQAVNVMGLVMDIAAASCPKPPHLPVQDDIFKEICITLSRPINFDSSSIAKHRILRMVSSTGIALYVNM